MVEKVMAHYSRYAGHLIAMALILVSASCAPDRSGSGKTLSAYENITFHPEDVSCTDNVSAEAKAEMDFEDRDHTLKIWKPAIEANIAKHKILADQGWTHSMESFGSDMYGRIGFLNQHDNNQRPNKTFPENTKNEMVLGFTYIYLAASVDSPYKSNALWMLQVVEGNHSLLKIPPEWIAEAKSNAHDWQMYCQLKQAK